MRTLLLITAVALVGACTWVKPTTGSHKVVLANAGEVSSCVKKGSTTSKTLSKFLFIPRSKDKISMELVMLAKNEAAIMGGDTIAAQGKIDKGEQVFGVYQCR